MSSPGLAIPLGRRGTVQQSFKPKILRKRPNPAFQQNP